MEVGKASNLDKKIFFILLGLLIFPLLGFSYTGLPLFIENVGQFDPRALFQVWGGGQTLWITSDAIWITLVEPRKPSEPTERGGLFPFREEEKSRKVVNIKISFPGANPNVRLKPFGRLDTVVSYFIGNDPAKWRVAVPVWSGVRYRGLYPGVDLEVFGEGGSWDWRWVAQNPKDLEQVKLRIEGVKQAEVLPAYGALRLVTPLGEFLLPLPLGRTPVLRRQEIEAKGEGFELGSPFALSPRVALKPKAEGIRSLVYSTFLGGNDSDVGLGIAVDASGAAYVTGYTSSSNFPTTPGVFDTTFNEGYDVFVVKLNSSGSSLVYATFLGGGREDAGYAIAVDTSGAAYVTGATTSSDFPTASGAYDTTWNPGYYLGICPNADAFVVKLNPSGNELEYATFLGGLGEDAGHAIAVDASGAAYVTGFTESSDFPTTPGAYDTTFKGYYSGVLYSDAFVVKLNPSGIDLIYSTFLGGSSSDGGYGIAVDASGAAYVTGETDSSDFPTTSGAFDTTYNGSHDAFVVKLNPSGTTLLYATFLGGSGADRSCGIVVDATGAAYVAGNTNSPDFPTTPGAFDTTQNDYDAFAVKLNPSGSDLIYSTFLGGRSNDWSYAIAVDASGAAYVIGVTRSSDFPTTPGAFNTTLKGDYDAFVITLNASGSWPVYATFLGSWDGGYAIAVDTSGAAYATGYTPSSDFPTTAGAFDTTFNGDVDAFVVKIRPEILPSEGYIAGKVQDASTGQGIQGAKVEASGPTTTFTLTDADGNYTLTLLPGTYELTASALGYQSQIKSNITVTAGQTVEVSFSLVRLPAPAAPTNLLPANGAKDIDPFPWLVASPPLQDVDKGSIHWENSKTKVESQWQISKNPSDFSNPIFDHVEVSYISQQEVEQAAVRDQWCIVEEKLEYETTYYWRVRYRDFRGVWSEWSTPTSFTTRKWIPPKPEFSWSPEEPKAGDKVMLDASRSSGGESSIAQYEWDLDGDGKIDGFTTSPVIYYRWDRGGTYNVILWVINEDREKAQTTKSIVIKENPIWERVWLGIVRLIFGSGGPSDKEWKAYQFIRDRLGLTPEDFKSWGVDDLKVLMALRETIAPEETPMTLGEYILQVLHDVELVDTFVNNPWPLPKVKALSSVCEKLGGVSWPEVGIKGGGKLLQEGIKELGGESAGVIVGVLLLLPNLAKVAGGLMMLYDALYSREFWLYINGYIEKEEISLIPQERLEYYEKLKEVYAEPLSGPNRENFKTAIKAELKEMLRNAAQKYKLWPTGIYSLQSPGELRVYDSQGRVTGVVQGVVREEIPGSAYVDGTVVIFPASDSYTVEIVGTEEGTYGLVAAQGVEEMSTFTASDVPLSAGSLHRYSIDWEALERGERGVTVQKDQDGDGTFEVTLTTMPPRQPYAPSPEPGSEGVALETKLSWKAGSPDEGRSVTYKVFFGTEKDPPLKATLGPFSATQTDLSWNPGRLKPATTYYWRVIAVDDQGLTAEGPVWSFSTASETAFFRADFENLEGWTKTGLWHLQDTTCFECDLMEGSFAYYAQPDSCTYEVKDKRGRSVRTSGTLTSPIITIPKNTALTLQFDFFREVEKYTRSTLDRTYVQIRLGTSGKTVRWGSWKTIWSRSSKDPSPECNTASYTFQSKNYDRLQIRFIFDSVNGNNNQYRGWAIDNLVVKPAPTPTKALEVTDLGLGWDVPEDFEPGEMKVLNIPNPVRDVHTTVFTVLGVEAEGIKVEVYDLTGRLVWKGEAEGNELPWDTRDLTGLPLANGVYLYLVYVKVEGEWIVSDVQKLVILR